MSFDSKMSIEDQIFAEWSDEFLTRFVHPNITDKLRFIWEKMVNQEVRLRELERLNNPQRIAEDLMRGVEKEYDNAN